MYVFPSNTGNIKMGNNWFDATFYPQGENWTRARIWNADQQVTYGIILLGLSTE